MSQEPDSNVSPSAENRPPAIPPVDPQKLLRQVLADLPESAVALTQNIEAEIDRLKQQSQQQIAEIREQAEGEVARVLARTESRRSALLLHAIEQLEPLQKDLLKEGELARALATLLQIQAFKSQCQAVLPDPGNLLSHLEVGQALRFQVTGSDQGPVWGTDLYTADSRLATAAVHAGVLELWEEGTVLVHVVEMPRIPIVGSFRNGVASLDWTNHYPVGYRVTKV